MAKRKTSTRAASPPIIRVQTAAPVQRAPSRARRVARRVGGAVRGGAPDWIPIVAAFVLGKMKSQGAELPRVLGLGPVTSSAVISLGVSYLAGGEVAKYANRAFVGLGSVAAYQYGLDNSVAGEGFDDEQ